MHGVSALGFSDRTGDNSMTANSERQAYGFAVPSGQVDKD